MIGADSTKTAQILAAHSGVSSGVPLEVVIRLADAAPRNTDGGGGRRLGDFSDS